MQNLQFLRLIVGQFFVIFLFAGSVLAVDEVHNLKTELRHFFRPRKLSDKNNSIGIESYSYTKSNNSLKSQESHLSLNLKHHSEDESAESQINFIFGGYPQNSFNYVAVPRAVLYMEK